MILLGQDEKEPNIEMDFQVISEDWSRYRIEDKTLIRFRINVLKIFRSKKVGKTGYPAFAITSRNMVSAIVPDKLKGKPPKKPPKRPYDIDRELSLEPLDVKWQEYLTKDYKIRVKPTLVKIFRAKAFNDFGEPIYVTSTLQPIVDVKKL